MRILFLSRWFPCPPNNGSKLRIYNLLKGLARQHEVTLLSFAEPTDFPVDTSELDLVCKNVYYVLRKPFDPNSRKARLGFFSFMPRSVIDTFSPEMKQHIEQLVDLENFDLVIASQIDMAGYSQYFSHLPALFEEVEVATLYERADKVTNSWQRLRHKLTWLKHRHYLNSLLKNFELYTVVSEQEKRLLTEILNGYSPVAVVPNCIDLKTYQSTDDIPQSKTLIFTGSFSYYPNYEAMLWFANKVFPRILTEHPNARLIITGNHANRPFPVSDNITLTGFVDDVRPYLASARISLAPIWTGGGTRLKILEAMALRTPVVATSKGAEGLNVQHEEHLLIADAPENFAQAVTRLLEDSALCKTISNNAYQLVQEKYDRDIVLPRFLNLIEQITRL